MIHRSSKDKFQLSSVDDGLEIDIFRSFDTLARD